MGDWQTMKEKIMAILMLLCTLPVVNFEKDITVTIIIAMFSLPLFTSRKKYNKKKY